MKGLFFLVALCFLASFAAGDNALSFKVFYMSICFFSFLAHFVDLNELHRSPRAGVSVGILPGVLLGGQVAGSFEHRLFCTLYAGELCVGMCIS